MRGQRILKITMIYTAYSFTLLMLILAGSHRLGLRSTVLPDGRPLPVFLMCLCNALFIAVRNEWIPNRGIRRLLVGLIGNVVIVWLIGNYNGWMNVSFQCFLEVFAICTIIYVTIWGGTYVVNKREERVLNKKLDLYKKKIKRK